MGKDEDASDELFVSAEFLEESSMAKRPKRRGGPYTGKEKAMRQNEVHRLHFEYGYSASRIS